MFSPQKNFENFDVPAADRVHLQSTKLVNKLRAIFGQQGRAAGAKRATLASQAVESTPS
jgi:hypothetical protein